MSDLSAIAEKGLRAKAETIHATLVAGTTRYEQVRGKRLQKDRTLVSVPIGQRYRLVYRELAAGLMLLRCLTHEDYNNFVRRL